MGVPKFFRFISERYPCISELIIKDASICDFDNLYLDMNGIIHMCSHPDDKNPNYRVNEEKMYNDIFHYISYLFQLIGPKKVFYLAIDGVAPRAKMNQQRSRRFQTAREAKEALKEAVKKGEKIQEGKQFDSNCITPGTVFMTKLHEQLCYFIKHKISTDRAWAKCKIIYSGHQTPGEGEHKIMDYIRYLRAQPGYDPNTRHCLYGLDADLIILGMCTHEPNFSILREEVLFNKRNVSRPSTPDENNFYLLHLSLLKNYIEQEFLTLKTVLPFKFDIEKIIDDWVLMGFLVGNDFIPNLPNLVINKDALPQLYEVYKKVLPTLEGYINEGGILNLQRFEEYMKNLAELDKKQFEENQTDLKYFEGKCRNRKPKNVIDDTTSKTFDEDLEKLINATNEFALEDDADLISWDPDEFPNSDDKGMFESEFVLHKRDYYITKLRYVEVTKEVLQSQAEGYVRAIQWILHYYYQGCVSWSWFYPHHYAPFLSDIINFVEVDLNYDYGKPFKPFEQLLGVLPISSMDLLPEAFHELMTSETSSIRHYYPEEFETDLNGKLQQWEAVVLIPFINEELLLSAMEPCYKNLTMNEVIRNKHGPMYEYQYTSESLGELESPGYFPPLKECHAQELCIESTHYLVPVDKINRGLLENPYINDYFPGVPTLYHIPFVCEFVKARVKVFEFPSRNVNAILHVQHDYKREPSLEMIASKYLGKIVWVGWPYLMEAKVKLVSSEDVCYQYVANNPDKNALKDDELSSIVKKTLKDSEYQDYFSQRKHVMDHYANRLGIDVDKVNTLLYVNTVKGYKYILGPDGKLVYGVDWHENTAVYPLQTVITDIKVAPVASVKPYQTIEEAFPVGHSVFIIMGPYYGHMAEIVDTSKIDKSGRIQVNMTAIQEPVLDIPEYLATSAYHPTRVAAAKCGISNMMFGRITSSINVSLKDQPNNQTGGPRKYEKLYDIGLNMKSPKTNERLLGHTYYETKVWTYSDRAIDIVYNYVCRFYSMFKRLEMIDSYPISESELFDDLEYGLTDVLKWIEGQPHKKYPWQSCNACGLDPEEMVMIQCSVDSQAELIESKKSKANLRIKPYVLFKPELRKGNVYPDPAITKFNLYDRIINVNPNSSVPFGAKGTIVTVINQRNSNSVKLTENSSSEPVYLVQFDKTFISGLKIEGVVGERFYMMHGFNMLNITEGCSSHLKATKKIQILTNTANVKNQVEYNNLRKNENYNSAFANYSSSNTKKIISPNVNVAPNSTVTSFVKNFKALEKQNNQFPNYAYTQPMTNPQPTIQPRPILNSQTILNPRPILNARPMINPQPIMNQPPLIQPQPIANQLPMAHPQPLINPYGPPPADFRFAPFTNMQQVIQPVNTYSAPPIHNIPPPMQQFAPNNGTEILKSLLKIESKPTNQFRASENIKDNIFPVNKQPVQQNPNQRNEYYATPPSNIQLPFPDKFVDKDASSYDDKPKLQDHGKKLFGNFMPPQFVPMQVTKRAISTDMSHSKPTASVEIDSMVINNSASCDVKSEVEHKPTPQPTTSASNHNPDKKRKSRSRMAANFNMSS